MIDINQRKNSMETRQPLNQPHSPQNPTTDSPPTNQPPTPQPSPSNQLTHPPAIVEKIEQLIIFTYFFIASILFFRFILSLFGANKTSPFVEFVYNLTEPFMFPFVGMFGRNPGIGTYRLEFEVIVALAVYALVMFGLMRLVRIIFR